MTLSARAITSGATRGLTVLALGGLTLWGGCKSAEDRYRDYSPKGEDPVVETLPPPLKSCSRKPKPQAVILPVPGAPLEVHLVRVYHLCLGKHVALLRLSKAKRALVQVVLEYERYDITGRHTPRRSTLPIARRFSTKSVRYHRLQWREGRVNPDERGLRVRLAAVDFADGKRWIAPPWPPSPAVVPPTNKVPGPLAPVDKIQKSLRKTIEALRKKRLKRDKKAKKKDKN